MAKAKKRSAKKKPAKRKPVKKSSKKATKKPAKKAVKKPVKKTSKKKTTPKKASSKKKTAAKKTTPKKEVTKKSAKKPAPKKAAVPVKKAPRPSQTSDQFDRLLLPLSDRLVVRVEGPSEMTAGGLYIPGTVNERPHQGEVLACGPGSKNKKGALRPLDVQVGDHILFNTHAGVNAEIHGQEVLILREDEVLGVLSTTK